MSTHWTEKERQILRAYRKAGFSYKDIKLLLPSRTLCAIKSYRYSHPKLVK